MSSKRVTIARLLDEKIEFRELQQR